MSRTIKLRPFNPKAEVRLLNSWLEEHGHPTVRASELPLIGITAYDDTDGPIAFGFLRRCEGGVGIFDSLVTHPQATSEARHVALELVFTRLIEMAKNLKLHALLGFSVDDSTLRRADRFGFKRSSQTLTALRIQ